MAVASTEKNPFLTSKHLAPANNLSHELGSSPGSQHVTDEYGEGEEEQEGSECSEESAQSEYAVEETVREDMAKLEDTFREIGMKFRMIARIGEGKSRNFLDRLQGRRHALRLLSERLGRRTRRCLKVDISSLQEKKERFDIGHQPGSTPPA
ncbi:hypothetical protein IMSHALPRED_005527 [Imshaugia aleurites]|uniref:Uncharacterized protein n=1 Tax=Imshaugia aleurites TaxID=172621 RepID=A0A8H3ENS1_9LECA|nr:hypothetical protein IMSHALPRED_005527 [Imshaugia aleurites]